MTRVEGAAQLAAIIAARLGEMRQPERMRLPAGRHGKTDKRTTTGQGSETLPTSISGDAIAQLIGQRVESLDANVPDRERKVFRIFLEAVLACEFGTEVVGDREFDALIDEVQRRMSLDERLNEAMRRAVALLLVSADSRGGPSGD